PTVAEVGANCNPDTQSRPCFANDIDFRLGISGEAINGNNRLDTKTAHDFDMSLHVHTAFAQCFDVLDLEIAECHSAMRLEGSHRRHDNGRIRLQTCLAALDVKEFFSAQIGAESGLGNPLVDKYQGSLRSHHRVAAMSNIGEGPAMDECRIVFQRLHQIGHERVLEQHGHGAVGLQIGCGYGFALCRFCDHDACQPPLQIVDISRQAQDGHDFGSNGDIEAAFARHTIAGTKSTHNLAQ